jgi:hypothetical protein
VGNRMNETLVDGGTVIEEKETAPADTPAPETVAQPASQTDDLDALLAEFDAANPPAPAPEPAPQDTGEDLDQLLAHLDRQQQLDQLNGQVAQGQVDLTTGDNTNVVAQARAQIEALQRAQ